MANLELTEDQDSGRLHIERLSVRKSWSRVYRDRVDEMERERSDNYVPAERKNLAESIAMGSVIAHKLGKHVRRKLRNKKYTCRRSIDNLKLPTSASPWNPMMGSQLVCDICGLSALNDCTSCVTCNAIAHRLCVGQVFGSAEYDDAEPSSTRSEGKQSKGLDTFEEDEDDDDDDDEYGNAENKVDEESKEGQESLITADSEFSYRLAVGLDEFQCGSCRLNEAEDDDFYARMHDELTKQRRRILAVRVVARRILAFIERARFKKLRKSLILLQSAIRKRRARRWLFYLRRNLIRVVIVDVMDYPEYVRDSDIVCLTIVDPMKHGQQFFRFDKTAEIAKQEGFFLPGVTAMQTIVITILRLEEHTAGTSYYMLAQTQLAVRDGDYNERRSYALSFNKLITWTPHDQGGDASYNYHLRLPPDRSKGDKMVGDDKPWLKTDVVLMHDLDKAQMKESQAVLHAELVENAEEHEYRRLSSLGTPSKSIPEHVLAEHEKRQTLEQQAEGKMRRAEEKWWASLTELDRTKIRIWYNPLNPCSSICQLVLGPPLEELRRPPETDLRLLNRKIESKEDQKLKTMVEGRTSVWWLCLCYLRLYFFQYHGDCRPRLVADVTEATVEVSPEYLHKTVVNVVMADKRSWLIEFEDFKLAQRFEFAVQESQKGFRKDGGSMFINSADVRKKKRDYGHHQPIL